MIKEDKQLLIKDLCARLPYGVKLLCANGEVVTLVNPPITIQDDCWNFKPYLRPMSSMTEEEYKEYYDIQDSDVMESAKAIKYGLNGERYVAAWPNGVDWLNAHHFDYRGLIEKSLAIVAPEGMYES